MIYGADTTFLIQLTVADVPEHKAALRLRQRILDGAGTLALAPQVLAEFIHIVTDPRRFRSPLSMREALRRSSSWWHLSEVRHLYPDEESISLFHSWMEEHRLGRKRILDTLLAAIFRSNGIRTVITSDEEAFRIFGSFEIVNPAGSGNR